MLKINEIFYSIQGESSFAGLPCIFIRLTYCNLRCSYCDTEYAFYEGEDISIKEILKTVKNYNCKLIEITGGEPLMQDNIYDLMNELCNNNYTVLLETSGSLTIENVDPRVHIIMDLKCPSSGMVKKNLYSNIDFIKIKDEIKFVIGNREDYDWAKGIILQYNLYEKCEILFSTVFGKLDLKDLAEWILSDNLKVRLQAQLHKYIWNPEKRGV